jgi:hypothetical protein
MPKVLEDSLGNLEYLMAALTMLGVLWLCYKQAGLQLSVSTAAAAGAAAGASSAQGFSDLDAGALRFSHRTHSGARSGFAGSLNNGPEFWSNSTAMDQLAGLANDQDNVDEVNEMSFHDRANRNWVNDAASKKPVVWTTEGFNNPVAKALLGR